MKKRILIGLVQYLGALLLAVCTLFMIYRYDSGELPLMDSDYLEARKEKSVKRDNTVRSEKVVQPVRKAKQTVESYISSLKTAGNAPPYAGPFGEGCGIAFRPLTGVRLQEGEKLSVRMGFLLVKDESGKPKAVYDGALNDVTAVCEGCELTLLRDGRGRPLFYDKVSGGCAYLENGKMIAGEYDAFNCDKGISAEYPSYAAACDKGFEVFAENGAFGLRKSAGGAVVIPAEYADVFGVCEGYCVAVDFEDRLHLFKPEGEAAEPAESEAEPDGEAKAQTGFEVELSGEYFAPAKAKRDASCIGCFFVDRGLTRARTEDGREILLRTDGTAMLPPSGFSVDAYSDGVALLKAERRTDGKRESVYGYMLHDGKWISAPEYSEALPFSEGLAAVRGKDGLWGMIDTGGNTVVPMLFDEIKSSSDGVILAYSEKYGYKLFNKTAS